MLTLWRYFVEINIIKIKDGLGQNESILVPMEEPLRLKINDREFITLMATPMDAKELFVGFLFTEGIIKGWKDILCLDECREGVNIEIEAETEPISLKSIIITSGCGQGVTFQKTVDDTKITTSLQARCGLISNLMKEFLTISKTTGVHAAALADSDGRILGFKEDIGRHNAIDKVLGQGLIKGINFEDKLLLSTGRLSSEMVLKTIKAKIPILIARSCATSMAIKWADMAGITIVGQVKGASMNVYTHQQRIVTTQR
ncbi:formate dehydrogenase family accessory protein FdhD [Candidatus Desantisbacteria bacterium CG_4_9_14_3_um_filter_40_11]|uniref:Sulfur carrier protein FdhD n=2 Tax=unclassified Candidatus Desantisiibacteriota TaxID=3106372 RepID=A0A2M8AT47_9BACT|nr:MAG: formate dehydrogenase family accessory protein FdhD [Candidatus Desantisbacteria bacterium CG23_combo_of_CG06-09_8_20_14_all_40_23]PJB29073.1 MAG: formate dehydrogenase family accessory protein FdhD [Candidatus Desantisbacteria bacterium CG_4_9_14_3_um_filter_40_11]